jgi:hypothetical protein
MTLGKVVAAAVIATIAFTHVAAPAQADTKKKNTADNRRIVTVVRSTTRITVRPRSFLDPGTETLQFNEHSADYAFPPLYTPYPKLGGIVGFWRAPLPDPVELPQFRWGNGY